MHSNNFCNNPIFIVGPERSGTTLLTTILSSHPNVAISLETFFFSIYDEIGCELPEYFDQFWHRYVQNERFLYLHLSPAYILKRIRKFGVPTKKNVFQAIMLEYSKVMQKPRWGEKTPQHFRRLDEIFDWFPKAKIIYTLRDPRATVSSRIVRPWALNSVNLASRIWRDSASVLENWSNNSNVHVVRYELLVTQTEAQVIDLCRFLEEPYVPNMILDRSLDSVKAHDTKGYHRDQILTALAPVHTNSLYKWKTKLTSSQIAAIEYITTTQMKRWGYECQCTRPNIKGFIAIILEIIFRRVTSFIIVTKRLFNNY